MMVLALQAFETPIYAIVLTLSEEWDTVVIAIGQEFLVGLDDFKLASTELIRRVKSSLRKSGTQEIRLSGEQASRQC